MSKVSPNLYQKCLEALPKNANPAQIKELLDMMIRKAGDLIKEPDAQAERLWLGAVELSGLPRQLAVAILDELRMATFNHTDPRFREGTDLQIARLGFEVTYWAALSTLQDTKKNFRNHPALLLALATYIAALEKGFDAFVPKELQMSIEHLKTELAKVEARLTPEYDTLVKSVLDEYRLFAGRLAQ